MTAARRAASDPVPSILLYAPRERVRTMARAAFPRRRARLLLAKGATEFSELMHAELVDAALIDLASGSDDARRVIALARDYPSAAFFGVLPLRAADGPLLATAAEAEFADVLVDGVDDMVARDLVTSLGFSARLQRTLEVPPPALGLVTPLQRGAWTAIVASAGRAVRTDAIAGALGVTREHLSRTFGSDDAPNLKRVIDFVRLVAASELAKNPGYDVRDVARVLGFASSSHFASTAQRVLGTRPTSLARLRPGDLAERFAHGRGRLRSTAVD